MCGVSLDVFAGREASHTKASTVNNNKEERKRKKNDVVFVVVVVAAVQMWKVRVITSVTIRQLHSPATRVHQQSYSSSPSRFLFFIQQDKKDVCLNVECAR